MTCECSERPVILYKMDVLREPPSTTVSRGKSVIEEPP